MGLPEGWREGSLSIITNQNGFVSDGDWVESKDQDPEGDVSLIQLADIKDGFFKRKSSRTMTFVKAKELRCTYLEEGDVLIARMPDPLGRACVYPGTEKKAVTVVDVCIVRTDKEKYNPNWLMYFINATQFRNTIFRLQSGTTRKRIAKSKLVEINLPIPSFAFQQQIVSAIETRFSSLDETIENLKSVKGNLEVYRKAILKKAFYGDMTEFENIVSKEKYSMKRGPFGGSLKKEIFVPEGYKVYEQKNAIRNNFEIGKYYITKEKFNEMEMFSLKPGDFIISCSGTIGKIAQIPENAKEGIINQALLKITLDNSKILNDYFRYLFISEYTQRYLTKISQGVAIKNVPSMKIMKQIKFPVPTLEEQEKIVQLIEEKFSVIDKVEEAVNKGLEKTEQLRKSILKIAFEGRLLK